MRVLLSGYNGSMGRVVSEVLGEKIVCGYGNEIISNDNYPTYNNIDDVKEEVDVIVDFSHPDNLKTVIEYAVRKKLPVVVATTGLTEKHHRLIDEASEKVAILQSGNFSLGINVMSEIVQKLSSSLRESDVEVIETHHRKKIDAPSGTAEMLISAIAKGRESESKLKYGRAGEESRDKDEIGVHSLRGGTVAGEHTVLFMIDDEVVEITHKAFSKKIFANGALKAAEFLINKNTGRFTMEDVF